MPQINLAENIRGEKTSNLSVGKYTIELSNINGAVIERGTKPEVVLIDLPSPSDGVLTKLQGDDELIDLESIIERIVAIFQSSQSVELRSKPGLEQTALLRGLATHSQINSLFSHKVIYLQIFHPEVEDILQRIWENFYRSDISYKPTPAEIQRDIADKEVLVILDENKLIQDEFKELFKSAANCKFIFTSSQRKILESKNIIDLTGWEEKDTILFLKNHLQNSLTDEELEAARILHAKLKGNPTYIKLAIANIVQHGFVLSQLVSQLPDTAPEQHIIKHILAFLTHQQRHIVDLLTVMGDVGLYGNQVVSITTSSEYPEILKELCEAHILRFDGSRYTLTLVIREFLSPPSKLIEPLENTLNYFKKVGQKYQSKPDLLCPEIDAILQLLEIAVTASRWQDVVFLGMSVESSLALNKSWGLWKQVLQRILQASQASQEKAIQAWAYHQLGTCYLCLEDSDTATDYLNKALDIRTSLDDQTAIVATGHHLDLLQLNFDSDLSNTPIVDTNISTNDTTLLYSQLESNLDEAQIPSDTHVADSNLQGNEDKALPTRIYRKGSFEFLRNPAPKKTSSPSKGIIAAGVFLSGGLVGLLSWDRITHTPENSTSDNSPDNSQSISPVVDSVPKPVPTPSSVSNPEPIYLAPIPEIALPTSSQLGKPPAPEPPLVPSAEHQHPPNQRSIYNFNPKLPKEVQKNNSKKSKSSTESTPYSDFPALESPSPPLPPLSPNIELSPNTNKSTSKVISTPKATSTPRANITPTPIPTPKPSPTPKPDPEPESSSADSSLDNSSSDNSSSDNSSSKSTVSPDAKIAPGERNKSLQKSVSNQVVPEPMVTPGFTPISVE